MAGENQTTHEGLVADFNTYCEEYAKFQADGNKSAATRARIALLSMGKGATAMRKEIQVQKKGGADSKPAPPEESTEQPAET